GSSLWLEFLSAGFRQGRAQGGTRGRWLVRGTSRTLHHATSILPVDDSVVIELHRAGSVDRLHHDDRRRIARGVAGENEHVLQLPLNRGQAIPMLLGVLGLGGLREAGHREEGRAGFLAGNAFEVS